MKEDFLFHRVNGVTLAIVFGTRSSILISVVAIHCRSRE